MTIFLMEILTIIVFSAEYGNHDMERHTVEYLKDLTLFPKVSRQISLKTYPLSHVYGLLNLRIVLR